MRETVTVSAFQGGAGVQVQAYAHLCRKANAWKRIHGTLSEIAGHSLQVVEAIGHDVGPSLEAGKTGTLLFHVGLIRGISRLGLIHHQGQGHLQTSNPVQMSIQQTSRTSQKLAQMTPFIGEKASG